MRQEINISYCFTFFYGIALSINSCFMNRLDTNECYHCCNRYWIAKQNERN